MLFVDIVDPAELTGAAREIPNPDWFVLNQYLPDDVIEDVEYDVLAAEIIYGEAKYMGFDVPTPIGKRQAQLQSKRGLLPKVGQKLAVGEYERIRLQTLQGAINGSLVTQAYRDTRSNVVAIRTRIERARAQLLSTGTVTITEIGGQTLTINFGVAPANLNVAPALLWSDPTADIWADLQTWWEAYATGTRDGFFPVPNPDGQYPGQILTSRRVMNSLRANVNVIRAVYGANAISGHVTPQQLNDAVTNEGFPPFGVYETRINGTRLIPDNLVILMPSDPNQLGSTQWGITAEALELAGSNAVDFVVGDAPGITAIQMKEDDPPTIWTKAVATALPILRRPDLLFTAAVLSADGL